MPSLALMNHASPCGSVSVDPLETIRPSTLIFAVGRRFSTVMEEVFLAMCPAKSRRYHHRVGPLLGKIQHEMILCESLSVCRSGADWRRFHQQWPT